MKNLKTEKERILVIGIGNCGRRDDGLGWKFTERVNRTGRMALDCEFRYQLQVEDVLMVCRYDKVVFADASHNELIEGFQFQACKAAPHYFFSSHLQSPETILYLAKELYKKAPEAYTLAIAGTSWGLGTSLSKEAKKNLQKAVLFFEKEVFQEV